MRNGAQLTTVDGAVVQAHGAGVLKVGRYYYMVGENRAGYRFRAVSLYRSVDLGRWEFRRDILTPASHPSLDPSNIERPKLIYNPATRKFVLWAHKENGRDYREARVVVATSDRIDGAYRYQADFRPLGHESRDMTLYVDDDGVAYLISAARSNYDLNIYRLDASFTRVERLATVLRGWHREAPALFKRQGVYFLITSGATGWQPNRAAYQTAPAITGPWTAPVPFGDARTYNSQSTYVLPVTARGRTSWLYMGDQWAPAWGGSVNASAHVWLPLAFPTRTSVEMTGASRITIDTAAGSITPGEAGETNRRLKSGAANLCITVRDAALGYGAAVVGAACRDTADSALELRQRSGTTQFVFQHSGLCLAQKDGEAAVVQRPCAVGPATWWRRDGDALINAASGKCLHAAAAPATATPIVMRPCNGAPGERWRPI